MNWNEYQQWVMTKAGSTDGTTRDALILSALGLTGEGGEFADTIKKLAYHDHVLTSELRLKLVIELGDILWYVARAADALLVSLEDVAALNVRKLNDRYPSGFDPARSKTKKSDDAVAQEQSQAAKKYAEPTVGGVHIEKQAGA
jgi:NTP pyrophosphatase (non-canonical NTP hydrolase)